MIQVRQRFIWALALAGVLLMAFLYWGEVQAGGQNVVVNIDNGTDVTEITELYSIDDDLIAELVAKAAACDHSFYWGKEGKWQLSPQAAYYDGEAEFCMGAGYRPQDTNVMFNLSVVPDEDSDQWLIQGGALIVLDD